MAAKLLSFLLFCSHFLLQLHFSAGQSVVRAAYWCADSGFPVPDIYSTLFTHLFCAFADLDSQTNQVTISSANQARFSTFTETVQLKNPSIKTLLSIEWRAAVDKESATTGNSKLLLSAALPFRNLDYPIQAIQNSLDWINVMAYDFNSPGRSWTQSGSGIPSNKLVLGLPFYGYAWRLVAANNHGFSAPASGPAVSPKGELGYGQIKNFISANRATKVYDAAVGSNYCYAGTTWIGYDDTESIRAKVSYVKQNGLLGYFAWHVGADDDGRTLSRAALFTHLICAFANINASSYQLSVSSSDDQHFSTFTNTVKQKNPSVTTLLSIGGGSANHSVIVSMAIPRLYGFQGLDFSWGSANTSSDMSNMAALFQEWRAAIDSETGQSKLILTAAVPYSQYSESSTYPIDSLRTNLNWLHVNAFDLYMPKWQNFTRAHAALYDPTRNRNTDFGIESWINGGLPANKLVLGLPLYGYAIGAGYIKIWAISYKDIRNYIQSYGANLVYNATFVVNYCTVGTTWIGFDDVEVVKVKVSFAKERKLLGYFVWQVPYDDNWLLSQTADPIKRYMLDWEKRVEIIEGTACLYGLHENLSLLEFAYELWIQEKGMEFMDPTLDDTNSSCTLLRCMQIALLCVQENANDRPTMLQVSSMLRNETTPMANPKRPAFSKRTNENDELKRSNVKLEICSIDDSTISEVVGR
ncbi:hypothetical protein PVK06_022332 [Gossypium arboreum]|uniref:GH18 domain-containing protein n=1 Tax=Gossypium arboreum TaxID=29729 RepID=A0ABR0P857_GOSAR|nr:hypothetical protein PVK06_022332 [Gossypium arboreum]